MDSNINFGNQKMTRQEAAQYLGVSQATLALDVTTHRHAIPYFKVGRKVYYLKADLDEWLMARRVVPQPVC